MQNLKSFTFSCNFLSKHGPFCIAERTLEKVKVDVLIEQLLHHSKVGIHEVKKLDIIRSALTIQRGQDQDAPRNWWITSRIIFVFTFIIIFIFYIYIQGDTFIFFVMRCLAAIWFAKLCKNFSSTEPIIVTTEMACGCKCPIAGDCCTVCGKWSCMATSRRTGKGQSPPDKARINSVVARATSEELHLELYRWK